MAKMTDESVAKALGWTVEVIRIPGIKQKLEHWIVPIGDAFCGFKDRSGTCRRDETPHFTTSLDAIVAEIEAQPERLSWFCHVEGDGSYNKRTSPRRYWGQIMMRTPSVDESAQAWGDTAPLALCAALLAYLKENKR